VSIRITKWRLLGLIVALVLLIDQLSKAWVLSTFALYSSTPLIPPVLYLTRSENTGAAFGIGTGSSAMFFLLSLAIMSGILYFYRQAKANAWLQHVALSLILGGALGNALDRAQHGVVIDFVHFIIPNVISNVSNFADHAISIGVVLLLIDSFRPEKTETVETPAEGEAVEKVV
jgi:signal peptidase II